MLFASAGGVGEGSVSLGSPIKLKTVPPNSTRRQPASLLHSEFKPVQFLLPFVLWEGSGPTPLLLGGSVVSSKGLLC